MWQNISHDFLDTSYWKGEGGSRGFPDLNDVYSQEMGMGMVQGKSLVQVGVATPDRPGCGFLGRFSDSLLATNITNNWQWGAALGKHLGSRNGQNIGRHTGSRSGQSIVYLYLSKSVKLVLLTMKSILPTSGLLWPFTFCQDLSELACSSRNTMRSSPACFSLQNHDEQRSEKRLAKYCKGTQCRSVTSLSMRLDLYSF